MVEVRGICRAHGALSPRYARCPRRRKQSTGLFSSATLPPCSIPLTHQNKKGTLRCLFALVEVRGICRAHGALSPRCARCPRRRTQSTGLCSSATLPPCSIPLTRQRKTDRQMPVCFVGGGEGNRTPVRKSIHTTFSGCSPCFDLPRATPKGQA